MWMIGVHRDGCQRTCAGALVGAAVGIAGRRVLTAWSAPVSVLVAAARLGCARCGSRLACSEDEWREVDGSKGAANSDSDEATGVGAGAGGAGGTNARNGAHASRAACRIASASAAAGTLGDETICVKGNSNTEKK